MDRFIRLAPPSPPLLKRDFRLQKSRVVALAIGDHLFGGEEERWMTSKVAQLLERYGYRQDAEPTEFNVRYWRSDRYRLPISLVNGIWECCDDAKVQRGTGSKQGLRRLELSILRSEIQTSKRRT